MSSFQTVLDHFQASEISIYTTCVLFALVLHEMKVKMTKQLGAVPEVMYTFVLHTCWYFQRDAGDEDKEIQWIVKWYLMAT